MSMALPLRFWLWLFNMTMGFSSTVFLYEAFVYNVIFVGRILPAIGHGPLALPFLVAFNLVWGLAFWSHLQAHCTDPGTVPQQWQEFVHSLGASIPIAPSRHEFQPGKATLCKRCNKSRPERAHHCQFCRACILRYDHHCPWISNCVGFNNHKFFLLTVLYGCMASVIAFTTALPELVYCIRATMVLDDEQLAGLATPTIIAFLVFGLVALLATIMLAMLLSTYFPFAARNLTTVEEGYSNMANPFDLGSTRANLEQIFGILGPDWLLPLKPFRPQTDGIFYPRASERVGPGLLEMREGRPIVPEEVPLTNGMSTPRFSSRKKGHVFAGQDWSLGDGDDVAAERLWKLRYHIGSARTAWSSGTEEYTPSRRLPFTAACCIRTPEEVGD